LFHQIEVIKDVAKLVLRKSLLQKLVLQSVRTNEVTRLYP